MPSQAVLSEIARIVSITTYVGTMLVSGRIAEGLALRFPEGRESEDDILDALVAAALKRHRQTGATNFPTLPSNRRPMRVA